MVWIDHYIMFKPFGVGYVVKRFCPTTATQNFALVVHQSPFLCVPFLPAVVSTSDILRTSNVWPDHLA
jgi:hypothetical protein